MYQPSKAILEKYADLMINFALNDGKGVQEGQVVYVQIPECAKPFYLPLQEAILTVGAYPVMEYMADGVQRPFFDHVSDDLLTFYPRDYLLSRVAMIDHRLYILAEADKHELEGVDPGKMFARVKAGKFYRQALEQKQKVGKYTWSLCLYGTQAMADEVGVDLETYWNQIIEACYLDMDDPISAWQEIWQTLTDAKKYLDSRPIDSFHVEGEDVNLHITLGEQRKWLGATGYNIPSFELYCSPDWRGTNGRIRFDQPLYRHGVLIEGIELTFENGVITKASARKNEDMLLEMIAQENANKVGEFSMTDKRFSRISQFMGETLYDENVGGRFGNTHIALGNAYKDGYVGNQAELSLSDWERLGFNESVIHTDIISTTDRIITATMTDGSKEVVYKDGMYTFV